MNGSARRRASAASGRRRSAREAAEAAEAAAATAAALQAAVDAAVGVMTPDRGDGPIVRIGANGSGYDEASIQGADADADADADAVEAAVEAADAADDAHRPIGGDGLQSKRTRRRVGARRRIQPPRQDAGATVAVGHAAIAAFPAPVGTVVVSDSEVVPEDRVAVGVALAVAPRGAAAIAAVAGWIVDGRLGLAVAGEHRRASGARLVRRQPQARLWLVDAAAVREWS